MEMRKNDFKSPEKIGEEVEIDFKELKTVINETIEGFALIDINDNEEIYAIDKLDKLFDIINETTIKKVSYIDNISNAIRLKKIYISLKNDKKYILESL